MIGLEQPSSNNNCTGSEDAVHYRVRRRQQHHRIGRCPHLAPLQLAATVQSRERADRSALSLGIRSYCPFVHSALPAAT
jgi:hypothetical protein